MNVIYSDTAIDEWEEARLRTADAADRGDGEADTYPGDGSLAVCWLLWPHRPRAREARYHKFSIRDQPTDSHTANSVHEPPVTGRLAAGTTQHSGPSAGRVLPPNHPIYKRWPRAIGVAVQSPDGKSIALYDGTGVFLTDVKGKRVRKVRITLFENLANEQVSVALAFRPDSKRVAVLTTLVYAEPMGAFIERLWTADVASGRSRRLVEWADRVQGSAPVTAERHIDGWTKDGKAVTIVGVVYGGEEMPTDARKIGNERVVVKDVPRTRSRYGK